MATVWVVVGFFNSSNSYDGTDSSIEGIFTSEEKAKELYESIDSKISIVPHPSDSERYDIFSIQSDTFKIPEDMACSVYKNQRKFLRVIYFERKLDQVEPVLLEY